MTYDGTAADDDAISQALTPRPERLVRLEEGCQLIAQARTIEEVKVVRDTAQAMAYLVKERDLGIQAQNDAAEIKIRAERKMGGMLAEMPKDVGGRPSENPSHDGRGFRLADAGLTWNDSSRFQRVATVPDEEFEQHVAEVRAKEEELTTAGVIRLAKLIRQSTSADLPDLANGCTVDDLHSLVASGRKFGTIYADPPWAYDNRGTRAAASKHYSTMTVEEIAALPVGDLATENAHLHLWTTNGFLFECPKLFDAWGFTYKSLFFWAKPQIGIGNYWRVSHEILLLGVRGSCPFADKSLPSFAVLDRERHSAKPGQVRMMIEKASPGPRLELFGRRLVPGWVVWGNEIEVDMFMAAQSAEEEQHDDQAQEETTLFG